jgi:Type I phosphodiesterase / nucleotide pyrophosphatase
MRVLESIATALKWGVVAGLAEGFWLLSPLILRTHHIVVESTAQWIELILILAALFAFLGALLGAAIGAATVVSLLATRRSLRDRERLLGFVTPTMLIPAYLTSGAFIYFVRFDHFGNVTEYQHALSSALPVLIVITSVVAILDRLTARWFGRPRAMPIVVAGVAVVGAFVLPMRVPMMPVPTHEAHALASSTVPGERHPLLVLAIDGGNWRTMQPLIDAGRLKTIEKLMRTGIHGQIEAEWPPFWSTSAWGAIATGHSRDEVGVFGDLFAKVPGLPPFQPPLELEPQLIPVSAVEYALTHAGVMHVSPPPRSALKEPPVWELLERSGVKTAVVRFNFTYPADRQASVVISNRVVPDMWDALGVGDEDRALVSPVSRTRELMAPFSSAWTPNPDELRRALPDLDWPPPKDALMDPIALLTKVLPYDQRTFHAAQHVLQSDPDLAVEIVHIGGFDNVCHAFWQYRFPGDFTDPPSPEDAQALGQVIDRYLEFIDRGLADLIAAFPTSPNVLIVSDHGEGPAAKAAPWRGLHESPGMILAGGPDVSHHFDMEHVSYYDVVPTILDFQRLMKSDAMRGRSLLQISEEGPQP